MFLISKNCAKALIDGRSLHRPFVRSLSWLGVACFILACGPKDRTPQGLWTYYCGRCHEPVNFPELDLSQDLYPALDLTASTMVQGGERLEVEERIREGWGPMPAYGRRLSAAEIDGLTTLVLNRFEGGKDHGFETIQEGVDPPGVPR